MNSLDPRVKRLPEIGQAFQVSPKAPLDQFGTYEVFVQAREGKSFQHEGIVHAPNLEMAFVLAKETFTRRFQCTSLFVTDTRNIFVSPTTEGMINAYNLIGEPGDTAGTTESYEIFHLLKRGKQPVHAGSVQAVNPAHAMAVAKTQFKEKIVFAIWAARTLDIRFTQQGEEELWVTLPEKKFRDASDYKGGDKLKEFLERNSRK